MKPWLSWMICTTLVCDRPSPVETRANRTSAPSTIGISVGLPLAATSDSALAEIANGRREQAKRIATAVRELPQGRLMSQQTGNLTLSPKLCHGGGSENELPAANSVQECSSQQENAVCN